MTDEWTWTYLDADAKPMTGETLVTNGFPSQSEAESWLGEQWRELADVGWTPSRSPTRAPLSTDP